MAWETTGAQGGRGGDGGSPAPPLGPSLQCPSAPLLAAWPLASCLLGSTGHLTGCQWVSSLRPLGQAAGRWGGGGAGAQLVEGHLSAGLAGVGGGGTGSALYPVLRVEWDKGGRHWAEWISEPFALSALPPSQVAGGRWQVWRSLLAALRWRSPAGQGLGPFSLGRLLSPLPANRLSIVRSHRNGHMLCTSL